MNKRQYKKWKKKLYKRRYYDVRQAIIYKKALSSCKIEGNCLLYIVDSKRMNLKHPISIRLLCNCEPVTVSTEQKEIDIEFECYTNLIADNSVVKKYLDEWKKMV